MNRENGSCDGLEKEWCAGDDDDSDRDAIKLTDSLGRPVAPPRREEQLNAVTSPRPLDRRVTLGRLLALAAQVAISAFAAQQSYRALRGGTLAEVHVAAALVSAMVGAMTGFGCLYGVIKASLGSIPYRICAIFSAGFIALAGAALFLVYAVTAILLAAGSFRLPGAISPGLSAAAGLGTILTLGTGGAFFAAYAYVYGMVSVRLAFSSDESLLRHPLLRGLDAPPSWDTEPLPLHPEPPARSRPADVPKPPPTPKVLPAPCLCAERALLLHELAPTSVLSRSDYPTSGPEETARYAQVRRCGFCRAIWWVRVVETDRPSYERDATPDSPPLSIVHDVSGTGLRCDSIEEAEALTPWYPKFAAAHDRFQRALRGPAQATPEQKAEATAAHAELLALARRHPASDQLAIPNDWLDWQPSELFLRAVRSELRETIAILEKSPADPAARSRLEDLQSRCAAARAADPAFPHECVTLEELWTTDLAGVDAFEFCLFGTMKQPRERIVEAWRTFHQRARWPSPAVEFRIMFAYASRLDRLLGKRSNSNEPDRVFLRLRQLLAQPGVRPPKKRELNDWLREKLRLPAP